MDAGGGGFEFADAFFCVAGLEGGRLEVGFCGGETLGLLVEAGEGGDAGFLGGVGDVEGALGGGDVGELDLADGLLGGEYGGIFVFFWDGCDFGGWRRGCDVC